MVGMPLALEPLGKPNSAALLWSPLAENIAVAIHSQPGFIYELRTDAVEIADSAVRGALGMTSGNPGMYGPPKRSTM